jgi:hypothetical protein
LSGDLHHPLISLHGTVHKYRSDSLYISLWYVQVNGLKINYLSNRNSKLFTDCNEVLLQILQNAFKRHNFSVRSADISIGLILPTAPLP